jgi:GNAT superfamily N-acetyltransferase
MLVAARVKRAQSVAFFRSEDYRAMLNIKHTTGDLGPSEQDVISSGFERHTARAFAPPFQKTRLNWLAYGPNEELLGALTADLLWDWIYIDELWTAEGQRGKGLGKRLMELVEDFATSNHLVGVWLWTQSWQAAEFYTKLGYEEFTRFEDFPKGHARIGLRKQVGVASGMQAHVRS